MRIAFRKAGVFRRIKPRVHAGENRKAPRRRQREIAFGAEGFDIGPVRGKDFVEDLGHQASPRSRRASPLAALRFQPERITGL